MGDRGVSSEKQRVIIAAQSASRLADRSKYKRFWVPAAGAA
jgi:hypothetical protein